MLLIGQDCNSAASALLGLSKEIKSNNIITLASIAQARANACLANKLNSQIYHEDLKLGGYCIRNIISWSGDGSDPVIDVYHALVSKHGAEEGSGSEVKCIIFNAGHSSTIFSMIS